MTFRDLNIGDVFEFDDSYLRKIAAGSAFGPWKKISDRKYEPHPKVHGLAHTVGSVNVNVKKVE